MRVGKGNASRCACAYQSIRPQHRQIRTDFLYGSKFLDYLWDFPIVNGPLSFRAWERQQPDLVTVGLRGDIPDTYLVWLHDAGISSDTFRRLVEHTVEIIYGSFYAAADDEEAHMHLQHVLAITEQNENISGLLSQFSQSRFIDRQGWGIPLSEAERDGWRVRAKATDA